MSWLLHGSLAFADVRTQDPSACVDPEEVDLEVRASLGDAAVDGLDLFVGVQADGDARALAIRVSDVRGDLLWEKHLAATAADCPILSQLVARSVEAGLAEVPGWRLRAERGRSRPEGAVWIKVSAPIAVRAGLGAGLSGQVVGPLWWSGGVDLYAAPFSNVGAGVVQVGGLGVTTGPFARARLGREALDVGFRVWGGAFGVVGRSFDVGYTTVLPHLSLDPEVWVVTRAALRVGLRAEVPLTRVAFSAAGQKDLTYEPAFRLGIVLGLGGGLRSGEALGGDRP
jgi:hypothetical protein